MAWSISILFKQKYVATLYFQYGDRAVPANEHAELADGCVDGVEAHVAGSKVEFLVICRVVGNVHLAVLAGYAAVGLENDRGVVVQTRCTTLEEACHEHYAVVGGHLAVESGGFAGYGFCQRAQVDVFVLAEIVSVVQLLKHYQLSAFTRELGRLVGDTGAVLSLYLAARLLYDSYFEYHEAGTK